ncbi:MAG: hypothetical protein SVX43_23240 [Cyanobacteriota bacterium]|nr:hypothetical protein [Cyanobacteriota bacterium]
MKKRQRIFLSLLVLSPIVLLADPFEAAKANRDYTSQPFPATLTGQIQRLQFAPGTTSTVVEHSVVRGMRDTYILRARAGQVMTVDLTSLEDNAVFELVAPNGEVILTESYGWKGFLPGEDAGDYKIIIGGMRGNATYTLNIEIL